jgi:hypothetical protein
MTAVINEATTAKVTGTIRILGAAGVSTWTWDKDSPASLAAAKAKVKELARTHVIERAADLATPGEQVRELPAEAECLIAHGPMMAG